MIITSVNNEKIKYLKKLKNAKFQQEEGLFLVEGDHLVNEAKEAGVLNFTVSLKDANYGVKNIVVTPNVMKSISSLSSLPTTIGVCKYLKENESLGNKVIILDGIQDPGNLGTIIRSSCAFGFTSVILSPNCVKKYNDKVIRSTQGMIFKTNVVTRNLNELIPNLINNGYDVYGTDVISGIDVKNVIKKEKIAVIMGSEGNGISCEVKSLISKNIYISIDDACESLNVAVAASIIMHELK